MGCQPVAPDPTLRGSPVNRSIMRRGGLSSEIDAGAVRRIFREWNLAECSSQLDDAGQFNAIVLANILWDHDSLHATSHQPDVLAQFHTRGELSRL